MATRRRTLWMTHRRLPNLLARFQGGGCVTPRVFPRFGTKRIKGFVSYSLVRTSKGGFSVTVCKDKAGTEESTRAARDWITKNARDTGAAKPTISEGSVILHLNPQPLPP